MKPVAQRVPVGVGDQQRQRPLAGDTARPRDRERHSIEAGHGQEPPPGDRIFPQLVDHEVTPARVHPTDPQRRHPEEVIGEPIDQFARGSAETARMVATNDGGELALVDQPGRCVEQRDQQLAVLGLERLERRAHRLRRGGELALDHIEHLARVLASRARQLVEPFGHEPPNPLGGEVRVLDDRQSGRAHHLPDRSTRATVLRVTEQDQCLVGQIEVAGIHQHLTRRRETLGAGLALNPPEPRFQRRRPRRPDQPVPLVQHLEQPTEPARPALGRVRPILRRAERVVGDEHLAPSAIEHLPDLIGIAALMRLPTVGQVRERQHLRDRGLTHLGRTGQHDEPMRAEHVQGELVRMRRPEDPSQLVRPLYIYRRPATNLRVDQRVEIAEAQD